MTDDYYELLEVECTADDEVIATSFRRLATQYHPNRNPGDEKAEARFNAIKAAYDILKDPQKRAKYDRFGPSLEPGSESPLDLDYSARLNSRSKETKELATQIFCKQIEDILLEGKITFQEFKRCLKKICSESDLTYLEFWHRLEEIRKNPPSGARRYAGKVCRVAAKTDMWYQMAGASFLICSGHGFLNSIYYALGNAANNVPYALFGAAAGAGIDRVREEIYRKENRLLKLFSGFTIAASIVGCAAAHLYAWMPEKYLRDHQKAETHIVPARPPAAAPATTSSNPKFEA